MRTVALVAASTAFILLSSTSQGALLIAADIGGTVFLCADNDPTCDTNLTTGILQIADQTINGVQVNGSIQTSVSGSFNQLDTSSLSIINNNAIATAITVTVGDTNYTGPATEFTSSGSGTFQGPIGNTVTLNWYDDPANDQGAQSAGDTPGQLVDTFSITQTLPNSQSFAHNDTGPIVDGALFSMTLQAIGTLQPGGTLLSRGETLAKPQSTSIVEPSSLMLLGAALLGFTLYRRRTS